MKNCFHTLNFGSCIFIVGFLDVAMPLNEHCGVDSLTRNALENE